MAGKWRFYLTNDTSFQHKVNTVALSPKFVATLENTFALPKEQSLAPMRMLQPVSQVT